MSIRHVLALVACCGALGAQAAPVTLAFTASGFQNAGTQYPGLNGPVSGFVRWNRASPNAPIGSLLDISVLIPGHSFQLFEVGIANEGATQTALGGLARGANAVVGDGQFNDFLLVFDRVNPRIEAFAFSLQGKTNAIWWTPAQTEAHFVTDENPVPEPSVGGLLAVALLAAAWRGTGRRTPPPRA